MKIKIWGCPKGATVTATDLRRRNKHSKIIPFERKSYPEKIDILLSQFLDRKIVDKTVKKD